MPSLYPIYSFAHDAWVIPFQSSVHTLTSNGFYIHYLSPFDECHFIFDHQSLSQRFGYDFIHPTNQIDWSVISKLHCTSLLRNEGHITGIKAFSKDLVGMKEVDSVH